MKIDFLFSGSHRKPSPQFLGLVSLVAVVVSAFAAEQPSTATTPASAAVTAEQITFLKERQDLLVESTTNSLARMQTTFAIVGGIFSLLTILIVFRQFQEQSHRNKLEEQNMIEVKGVMTSFKDNITTINSLITMLQGSFAFQDRVKDSLKEIDTRIKTLDESQKQDEVSFRSRVDSLNGLAAEAFKKCDFQRRDREAFKREDNRIALQSVASLLTTLEQIGNLRGLASPVVVFLRAMSRFNRYGIRGRHERSN